MRTFTLSPKNRLRDKDEISRARERGLLLVMILISISGTCQSTQGMGINLVKILERKADKLDHSAADREPIHSE